MKTNYTALRIADINIMTNDFNDYWNKRISHYPFKFLIGSSIGSLIQCSVLVPKLWPIGIKQNDSQGVTMHFFQSGFIWSGSQDPSYHAGVQAHVGAVPSAIRSSSSLHVGLHMAGVPGITMHEPAMSPVDRNLQLHVDNQSYMRHL